MELSLHSFPDDRLHTSGFLGLMTLDAVTQVCAMLSRGRFSRMINLAVPMVLFDPSLNGTPSLSNTYLPILVEDALFSSQGYP
jgi:hypothetical protein